MGKITNYFAQPVDPPPIVDEPAPTTTNLNQQIYLNMESVLAAVSKKKKRKHKKKHRKHEKEKEASSVVASTSQDKDDRKEDKPEPVTSSMLTDSDDDEWNKPTKIKNAFSVLMAARVKVIGDNVEGKVSIEASASTSTKKRNREVLQKWADEKGGRQRKEAEKNREKYVTTQLEKRKSRLEKMLCGAEPRRRSMREKKPNKAYTEYRSKIKTIVSSSDEDTTGDEADEFVAKLNSPLKDKSNILNYLKRTPKHVRPKKKVKISDCSTDDEPLKVKKSVSDESTDDEPLMVKKSVSDESTDDEPLTDAVLDELKAESHDSDASTDEEPLDEEILKELSAIPEELITPAPPIPLPTVRREVFKPVPLKAPPKVEQKQEPRIPGQLTLDSFKRRHKKALPKLESGFCVKVNVIPAEIQAFHQLIILQGFRKKVRREARLVRYASATLHGEKLDLPFDASHRRAVSLSPACHRIDLPDIKRVTSMRSQSLSPTNIDIAEMAKEPMEIGSLRHSESFLCHSPLGRSDGFIRSQSPVALSRTESSISIHKPVALRPTESFHSKAPPAPQSAPPQSPPQVEEKVNSRPRRSCTLNRINYGSPETPEKVPRAVTKRHANDDDFDVQPKSVKRQKRSRKNADDDDDEEETIIVLNDDSNDADEPAKLAPIFKKRLPKPAIDPKVAQAKRDFLQSGLPEVMQKEKDDHRQFLETYEEGPTFPVVSHVGFEDTKLEAVDWSLEKFKLGPAVDFPATSTPSKFKFNIDKLNDSKIKTSFAKILDRKSLKRQLKVDFAPFPVNKAFHQLQKCSTDDGLLFVDKYRPTSTDHFLVNHTPVLALKKFLSNWTEDAELRSDNSDDDFEGFSQSSSSSAPSNVICLVGPAGSGKTSSVMALAQEMNFNVLEVNAGGERNGKKMLKDLLEATKSHGAQDSKKLALILIEDADVVFPEDDGFLNGLNQLIANSKRPVILTANHKNALHLQKYISGNCLEYKPAATVPIAKWVTCVAACESYNVDVKDVERLYGGNQGDLRKTLTQMEFYLGSGGDCDAKTEKHQNISKFFLPPEKMSTKIVPEKCDEMAKYMENSSFASQLKGSMPNLGVDIANEMQNLETFSVESCPKKPSHSFLYENLEACRMNSRNCCVEYEPILRQICRTEVVRNKNGRKCRTSHFLRDTLRFRTPSLDFFEKFSCIFTEDV